MNVDVADLRGFVAVAELRSFQAAAAQLNLSQPALSRRVRKLEAALGVTLLERTTRRVELTSIGRDFLPRMRRLLDELESSLLAVREIAERRGGQVSIACIPSATAHLLPDAIRAFNARFPQIRDIDVHATTISIDRRNAFYKSFRVADTGLAAAPLPLARPR